MFRIATSVYVKVIFVGFLFISPSLAFAADFIIDSEPDLHRALAQANKNNEADTITLLSGEYRLQRRLVFSEKGTVLKGHTGVPGDVVLSGRGMRQSKGVEVLVDVQADKITVTSVTLQNAGNHLIQVRSEKDADNFTLTNCVLRDAYEQMLKVSSLESSEHYSDNGKVEHCVFEYTKGIGPQYYIGGIDAHKSRNWLVQNNRFENIASPSQHIAEHAVHFWKDSSHTQVLNNTFINNDRGVGFGLGNRGAQHNGGLIKNNVFFHLDNHHPYADASIILERAPNAVVQNNLVVQYHSYPNAIEYRFKETKGVVIEGNTVNRRIASRNGGIASVIKNEKQR
ncbi:right-handed parallel beta-helix repeat-containing protein [Alteromonas sp. 5E99-2]|uniref:right-handed parallel beta-helix repeat-containing protein n=1 Tax=Alteromonas sp. 5E99-2 TaxID=2817683 RepID=UPI001A98D064|nr:right-handed parallel beta-helix repeat-containing protein [Alteromonas sp. 5E99-2]MBO1256541.1 right-handed parallel beta-helix repeat-containing protein [Alteromonas sp. 5E99-2]